MLNPMCEEGRGWEEFFNWADGGGDTIMNMATVAVKSMGRGHNIHVLGTSWGFLSCQGSFTPLGRGPAGAGWCHPGHWCVDSVHFFRARQIMK